MGARVDRLRRLIGSALSVYGIACFMAGGHLAEQWGSAAPDKPNPGLGLVMPYDHHGAIRYVSAFQATYERLLLDAWWLVIVALIVIPKGDLIAHWRRPQSEDADGHRHDNRAALSGILAGVALAAATLAGVGPWLVHWLNARGVVLPA